MNYEEKIRAVKQWNQELHDLCNQYLEHDCYIYMGLIQKFGELEEILFSDSRPPEAELVRVKTLNPYTNEDNTPKHDDYDLYYRKKS